MKTIALCAVVYYMLCIIGSVKHILRGEYPRYPKVTCGGEVWAVIHFAVLIWFFVEYLMGGR